MSSTTEEVRVAVASNFAPVVKELAKLYHQETTNHVKLSFGSSGKLFAQIIHGAPFDIFLSADQSKPIALVKAGVADDHQRFTYAIGQLALMTTKPAFYNSLKDTLISGSFNKLALANPKLAPYGMAAQETLQALDLISQTRNKWVQGENISQTYQFVATGNADLGFVALSQIKQDSTFPEQAYWQVPENFYNAIRQDAVLLKKGENKAAAQSFIRFIQSTRAKQRIKAYGYITTDNTTKQ